MKRPIKALALMSTGLDSLIAAKLVKDQGVDVHGVTFFYRFDNLAKQQASGEIQKLVEPLGIPITVIDISDDFLPTLLNPPHGYGSNFNPCIDCHLFMFHRAYAMMQEMGAQFLITGEVMGQRPMSQNSQTLTHMSKIMEFSDLLLRPMSAKLLPETLPEREGWVDREALLDISGRSRKRQFELVEALGIEHYSKPGGGCILTIPQFGKRAKALKSRKAIEQITVADFELMRLGRHLWPSNHLLVVVGRHEEDNTALEAFVPGRTRLEALDISGPVTVADGIKDEADLALAAQITVRYCGGKVEGPVRVQWSNDQGSGELQVVAANREALKKWLI